MRKSSKLIMVLIVCLVANLLSVTVYAQGQKPTAKVYLDQASHYTDVLPIKFKLQDDKSLKNGFFVFLLGDPASGYAQQLYAEQIKEEGSSIILNREIDITPCEPYGTSTIYLVVIDADGNESLYDCSFNIKPNAFLDPTIRVKNPLADTNEGAYVTYMGYYPTFNPTITITDYDSRQFTCKYYVDGSLYETKLFTASSTGTHTFRFDRALAISSLTTGKHTIKFEVTDGSRTGEYVIDINKY